MPGTSTERYGIATMDGSVDEGATIDDTHNAAMATIDAKMAGTESGALAARPDPGIVGRFFIASDTGQVFLDFGATWIELTLGGAPVSVPTGTILAFGASTPPAGYLRCDGSAISRTTYAALFAVIGTEHGAGNGTGTFNVPDMRGRAAVGSGQGTGLTNRVLGSKFGQEDVALTEAQLAAHDHPDNIAYGAAGGHGHVVNITLDGGHGHTLNIDNATVVGAGNELPFAVGSWAGSIASAGSAQQFIFVTFSGSVGNTQGSHRHTGDTNVVPHHDHTGSDTNVVADHAHPRSGGVLSAGSGQAHENMPPSTALNYIIKT